SSDRRTGGYLFSAGSGQLLDGILPGFFFHKVRRYADYDCQRRRILQRDESSDARLLIGTDNSMAMHSTANTGRRNFLKAGGVAGGAAAAASLWADRSPESNSRAENAFKLRQ